MKNAMRNVQLKRDLLMKILEKSGQSASEIALSVGVSRPTAVKVLTELVDAGLLRTDDRGRFLFGECRMVVLKADAQNAHLITFNGVDKSLERIELKPVLSMSEDDNISRYINIAERYIDDLVHKSCKVLSAIIADGDLRKPKMFGAVLNRGECVKVYLSYAADKRSILYLSANSPVAHFYFGCEPISSTNRGAKLSAKVLENVFDIMLPERLVIDGAYLLGQDAEADIRDLCEKFKVEFLGNSKDSLSMDEFGAICALFEEYFEQA